MITCIHYSPPRYCSLKFYQISLMNDNNDFTKKYNIDKLKLKNEEKRSFLVHVKKDNLYNCVIKKVPSSF